MIKKKPTKTEASATGFSAEYVRDVSEMIYRDRLGEKDVASMIEKDGDGGVKLRQRAGCFDSLTRSYLKIILELP